MIAGIDEAGRGPLAGPVVAAAVIFDPAAHIKHINDSKKLTPQKREELYLVILEKAISYSVAAVSNFQIDRLNILQASLLAMKNAANRLQTKPDLILVDGNKTFVSDIPAVALIKGDEKSFSIAAASIIAKVTRDRIMRRLSIRFPNYLWHKNKGYPTKEHIDAIRNFGPTVLHRKSFLQNILLEYNDIVKV